MTNKNSNNKFYILWVFQTNGYFIKKDKAQPKHEELALIFVDLDKQTNLLNLQIFIGISIIILRNT